MEKYLTLRRTKKGDYEVNKEVVKVRGICGEMKGE